MSGERSVLPEDVSTAMQQLNVLIDNILFVGNNWPPNPGAVSRRLRELGLTKTTPDAPSSFCVTELGEAVEVDLFCVFLGIWDDSGIPLVLEPLGLFSQADSEYLWDGLEAGEDMWSWLRPRLQDAYRKLFSQRRSS